MPRPAGFAAGALALAVVLALLLPAAASAWNLETVDSPGVGAHSSLRVGPGGTIHISYSANSYGYLKYAFWNGSSWACETVDNNFLCGPYTNVAVDHAGNPHIAYLYYTGRCIRYASKADGAWSISQLDTETDMDGDIGMALDSQDHAHVSYWDGVWNGEAHDLSYGFFDGSSWTKTVVDAPGTVGRGSSIAVDSHDRPWISYYDESHQTIKVAHFDGVQWVLQTVDNVEFIGFNFRTAITVDAQDRVHLAWSAYHYASEWLGRLRYGMYDGTWHLSTIEESGNGRDFRVPSIRTDADDRPVISYILYYNQEPIDPDMKCARFNGTNWATEFVDTRSIADSDYSNGLDLDASGRPHISYAVNSMALTHAVGAVPTSVRPPERAAGGFALLAPWPNPAAGEVRVGFLLPRACAVDLALLDAGGRRIGRVAAGAYAAGEHALALDPVLLKRLPAGSYLIDLRAEGWRGSQKLVIR